MANNRMYLVNRRTGDKVFIGKYYPSTGWYISDPDNFISKVSNAFHRADFGEITYEEAQRDGVCANGGMWGDTSWCIQYESVDEVSNDTDAQAKINIINSIRMYLKHND